MSVSFEKDHLQNTEIVVAQRSWLLATSRALSEKSIAWHQLRVSSASAPLRSITGHKRHCIVLLGVVPICKAADEGRDERLSRKASSGRLLASRCWTTVDGSRFHLPGAPTCGCADSAVLYTWSAVWEL